MPGSTYLDWDQNYASCSRVLGCIRGLLKIRLQHSSSLSGKAAIANRSKRILDVHESVHGDTIMKLTL